MDSGYLSRREYDRLSLASKDLVKMAGGEDRALEITGYKQRPQISRCTTINADDRRFFTIKAIAELEADVVESGFVPPVTKALADLAGFDLVRRDQHKGDTSALASAGAMMRSAGDAIAVVTEAYADGRLDADEKANSIMHLEGLAENLGKTLAILRGEKVSE